MKSVIKQAIENLEQQRKSLKEMDLLGVLLDNEFAHKSNQINTIQLILSKLLPVEEEQIKQAFNDGYFDYYPSQSKFGGSADDYFEKTFKMQGVV